MRRAAASPKRRETPTRSTTEETLVTEALHLPGQEAKRWSHTPLEEEELVAEGLLALATAARRFDPSYDVPFAAFARPRVRGAITDAVRHRARRDRLDDGVYADVVVFSALAGDDEQGPRAGYEPVDPGLEPPDTVEQLECLRTLATLPERERIALVRTAVDGETAAEVAEDLGVSPNRVYALVQAGAARVRRRAA